MQKVKIDIPPAYEFLKYPFRYKSAWGGRGAARSWSFARALLLRGVKSKLRILCTREFQKSIKDSVHKLLCDQIDLMNMHSIYEIKRDNITSKRGTEFLFAGLKHNITNIKSMEGIDICWVEEAEKVSEDSWDILIPTIRKEGSEIWVSFNADLETDPTYKRLVLHPPPDSKIVKTSWMDNLWFPDVLKKEKDYMYTVDSERAAWIWEGECRSHSDAQIMKNKWIIDVFEPPYDKMGNSTWFGPYYGCDWGFAVSPLCLIRFWIKPANDYFDLMIEYEKWGVRVDLDDHKEFFNDMPGIKGAKIYADLARPETINMMINLGFSIVGAPKWPGCVEDGITWIRSARKIVIHERCKHTIDDARNYSYKIDPLTGDVLPIIIKKHDDTWDAIRYGATPFIHGVENYGETVIFDEHVNISPV